MKVILFVLGRMLTLSCVILSVHGCRLGETHQEKARKHFSEGERLALQEQYSEAAREFRHVVELAPGWPSARDNLAYCMKRSDPIAWFTEHPDDEEAWTLAFQIMINSNLLDEAQHHIDRLPLGRRRDVYQKILETRKLR